MMYLSNQGPRTPHLITSQQTSPAFTRSSTGWFVLRANSKLFMAQMTVLWRFYSQKLASVSFGIYQRTAVSVSVFTAYTNVAVVEHLTKRVKIHYLLPQKMINKTNKTKKTDDMHDCWEMPQNISFCQKHIAKETFFCLNAFCCSNCSCSSVKRHETVVAIWDSFFLQNFSCWF